MLKIRTCKTYAEAITAAGIRAAEFGKNPKRKLFAFCEDKLTMSLETEIARACGGGTFNVQVTTFSRFIHRYGRVDKAVLDKETSSMVVKNILLKNAGEMSCFKRAAYNPGTAVTLYELIAQLKSASVTPEALAVGMEGLSGALRGKLQDIHAVYKAYEEYIRDENCLDSNSYLSLMNGIVRDGDFTGCSAMLVGFGSLTRQGVEIVKTLAERMEDLTVFLLSGENGQLYTNELKELLLREIGGFCVEESNAEIGEEREKLRACLFEPTCFSTPRTETDKIFVYDATDFTDEVEHIASIIRREIVGGKRYKDMAVALGSPEGYRAAIYTVFGNYGIPYFLDDPRVLSTHPIAGFVIGYLDLKRSFSVKELLAFVKNPCFGRDKREIDRLENFLKNNAVTAKRLKSGLKHTENDVEAYGKDYALFEDIRRECLLAVENKCFTVSEYVEDIKGLLEKFSVRTAAEAQAKRLRAYGDDSGASFTEQAYGKAIGILDSVARIMGGAAVSLTEFKNVILSGFSACEISVLPQLADAVYVGNYKDCKYLEHKILFAGGLSGEVPFTKSDTALLNDVDLRSLKDYDCIVEPTIKIVNKRERENVGVALLSFTERLYLSSSATDSGGKLSARSRITDYFSGMFSQKGGGKLPVVTAAGLEAQAARDGEFRRAYSSFSFNAPRPAMLRFISNAGEYKEGLRDDFSTEAAYFSALRDILPDEATRAEELLEKGGRALVERLEGSGELIFNKNTVSASVLESYFGCPFACFMRYGLKLSESKGVDVKSNEYGNFLHSVLEDYIKVIKSDVGAERRRITDRATSDGVVDEIFAARQEELQYSKFLDADKYAMLFALVRKEAKRVAFTLFEQLNNSGFVPVETEAAFGDGKKYKAITLKTPYGEKKIKGKIDRVDRSGKYVRIIDYKTGKTHEEDESFYTGNNLQLYLYMNAFLSEGDLPGGAYYFPVSDSFKKDKPVYAMRGKTLSQSDVFALTDGTLREGNLSSDVLGAKFTEKNGELTPPRGNKFLTAEEFGAYLKYAVMVSEKGATEISEGVIAPSPYDGECRFCEYSAICGFDEALNTVRKESGVSSDTVVDAVEVENELNN